MSTELPVLTPKDFASDQELRWCPRCGDYSILAQMKKVLPTLGIPQENFLMVSGIGCAARFPYYVDTYGVHGIHGRAPAIATGAKLCRPDLQVWVISGDGDALSIGGNHLMHAIRRNVNLKIILFNNQIYGLTKGQFSPTSEVGKVTKSSPVGLIARPFNPVSVALGAEATFVARTHDLDRSHMQETFRRAHEHPGAAFVEVLQNCNVFNDGAFAAITKRDAREEMLIDLRHGEPILFGSDRQYGVIGFDGAVAIAEVAEVGLEAVLIHDETRSDPSRAFALSRLAETPTTPTPIGVFRAVEHEEYGTGIRGQVDDVQSHEGLGDLDELLHSLPTWEV